MSYIPLTDVRGMYEYIRNYEPNRILGTNMVPEVDDTEKLLPRTTRSILARLHSGWSIHLQNYKARIDCIGTVSDLCPQCRAQIHDAHHLFECPCQPTNYDPTSLWTNPVEMAKCLGLEME